MVQIAIFQCSTKECNPELRFLRSAHHLILMRISQLVFEVTERTRFCDGQTDRQTDRLRTPMAKTTCLPFGGRHNNAIDIIGLIVIKENSRGKGYGFENVAFLSYF